MAADHNYAQLAYDWAQKAEQNRDDKDAGICVGLAQVYAQLAGWQQWKRFNDNAAAHGFPVKATVTGMLDPPPEPPKW
jgi:hypothetical protein